MTDRKAPTNITYEVKGDVLAIAVDLTQRHGPSSTGKTTVVGTTHGNIKLPNGMFFSVNAYLK